MFQKLWVKLILLSWSVILIGQIAGGVAFLYSLQNKLSEDFEKNAQEQVQILAFNLGSMVSDLNPDHLHHFIENTAKLENVSSVVIYDSQGDILTDIHPQAPAGGEAAPAFDTDIVKKGEDLRYMDSPNGGLLNLSQVIYRKVHIEDDTGRPQEKEVPIAVATMNISLNGLHQRIHELMRFFIFVTLFLLVSMGASVYFFLRWMLRPLPHLTLGAMRIGQGDLNNPIPLTGKDELGALSSSFEQMRRNLGDVVQRIHWMSDRVLTSSRDVSGLTKTVNAATDEVSQVVQEIANGTNKVAHEATETYEIMKKMAVEVEQVADRCKKASDATTETSFRAKEGGTSAGHAVRKMQQVNELVSRSAEVIRNLGKRSDQIGEIVEIMKEIADQTNLLALNAAIEAARAGNEGRGFAVVAEEIRNLADKSAKSSKEISELVETIRDETQSAVHSIALGSNEMNQGRQIVERAGESLEEIVKSVHKMAEEVSHISQTAGKMLLSSSEVMKRMEEVAAIAEQSAAATQEAASSSQQTSASMSEVSAAANVLKAMADDLKALAGRFKVNDSAASRS